MWNGRAEHPEFAINRFRRLSFAIFVCIWGMFSCYLLCKINVFEVFEHLSSVLAVVLFVYVLLKLSILDRDRERGLARANFNAHQQYLSEQYIGRIAAEHARNQQNPVNNEDDDGFFEEENRFDYLRLIFHTVALYYITDISTDLPVLFKLLFGFEWKIISALFFS